MAKDKNVANVASNKGNNKGKGKGAAPAEKQADAAPAEKQADAAPVALDAATRATVVSALKAQPTDKARQASAASFAALFAPMFPGLTVKHILDAYDIALRQEREAGEREEFSKVLSAYTVPAKVAEYAGTARRLGLTLSVVAVPVADAPADPQTGESPVTFRLSTSAPRASSGSGNGRGPGRPRKGTGAFLYRGTPITCALEEHIIKHQPTSDAARRLAEYAERRKNGSKSRLSAWVAVQADAALAPLYSEAPATPTA